MNKWQFYKLIRLLIRRLRHYVFSKWVPRNTLNKMLMIADALYHLATLYVKYSGGIVQGCSDKEAMVRGNR
jgi:hypothetical protein